MSRKEEASVSAAFGTADLLSKRIEAAEAAAWRLQEATREANSTLGAIKAEKTALEAVKADLVASLASRSGELVDQAVREQLEVMGKATEAAMQESVKKVGSEFDKLEKIYLGEGPTGQKSIRQYTYELEQTFGIGTEKLQELVSMMVALNAGCTGVDCNGVVKYAVLMRVQTPDGTGEMHTHLCYKHYRSIMDDPAVTVVKYYKMEDGICPFKHPPVKVPMLYDEDDKKWYPAKHTFVVDKEAATPKEGSS
jgi:hypothetical protein